MSYEGFPGVPNQPPQGPGQPFGQPGPPPGGQPFPPQAPQAPAPDYPVSGQPHSAPASGAPAPWPPSPSAPGAFGPPPPAPEAPGPYGPPPGGQPPFNQPPPPWGGGYPGGGEFGPPPPRKSKTGLIVGIIIGVVILLAGVGVGGFLLLGKDDKDKKDGGGKNIERLAEACPLLSAEEVGEQAGVKLTSKETARRQEGNRIRLQCSYVTSDQRLYAGFIISIFNDGLCEPQACVDRVKRANDEPVEGVGDAAVFGIAPNNRGQLFAVKSIGSRSIGVDVTGPGANTKAENLKPFVEKVFKKLDEGDYKEGDEIKAPAGPEQPVA